jgi:hypothetical protein
MNFRAILLYNIAAMHVDKPVNRIVNFLCCSFGNCNPVT